MKASRRSRNCSNSGVHRKSMDFRFEPSSLKDDAVIMHPLARNDELSTDLDDSDHNLYFAQAAGAVFMRQALLTSVLDRLDRISDL